LEAIAQIRHSDMLDDLRAWLANRRTCHQPGKL
jgi:hypothetical protein